jgi:aspartyl-tRNA synthetase
VQRTYISETSNLIGQKIKLAGWVDNRRDHGKIIFIDLRDRSGLVQLVFLASNKELWVLADKLRSEWVISIEGKANERPEKMQNPDLPTGKIEVLVEKMEILSEAKTPPFEIGKDGYEVHEDKRMKYRYLDLRRERLQKNIFLRHKIIQFIRQELDKLDFMEIETPIMTKSTPEGARDYIVPARLNPGKFYALPQSPQQYKQLLMVAGMERYFQIARCFRDEDTRGDRQPEFTQLDIETSFWSQEEILEMIEKLYIDIVAKFFPEKKIIQIPFPRITYKEAMEKYGNDRPDLRKNKEDKDELAFCFVVDFPAFEWREEGLPSPKASEGKKKGRWDAVHHPFTRPQTDDVKRLKNSPKDILAYQYDLALNGHEIGGGSLRTYKPEVLQATFEIMGHSKENILKKFGHLLEAFEYGVPPHGGIAMGLDRLFAILFNESSIREVIAFPKTGDGRDLMMDAPSEVDEGQLKELKIKLKT